MTCVDEIIGTHRLRHRAAALNLRRLVDLDLDLTRTDDAWTLVPTGN